VKRLMKVGLVFLSTQGAMNELSRFFFMGVITPSVKSDVLMYLIECRGLRTGIR